jgi:hypothetical protein
MNDIAYFARAVSYECKMLMKLTTGRLLKPRTHDTQHNDIQHNDTQHKGLICDTQQK